MPNPETTIPRGDLDAATLRFPKGLASLHTRAADTGDNLIVASFTGPQPDVEKAGEIVSIRYPRSLKASTGRLTIADDVTWTMEAHNGGSDWDLDLRQAHFTGMLSSGGATRWTLRLPEPNREVLIDLRGGVTDLTITRPHGSGLRLTINGGANDLQFDNQRFENLGPTINLESEPDDPSRSSYRVEIRGGANRLRVTTE